MLSWQCQSPSLQGPRGPAPPSLLLSHPDTLSCMRLCKDGSYMVLTCIKAFPMLFQAQHSANICIHSLISKLCMLCLLHRILLFFLFLPSWLIWFHFLPQSLKKTRNQKKVLSWWDFFRGNLRLLSLGKAIVTVVLPDLWCMLGVLVSP